MRTVIRIALIYLGILAATAQAAAQSVAVYRETKEAGQEKHSIFVFVNAPVQGNLSSLPVTLVKMVGDQRVVVLETVVGADKLTVVPDKGVTFSVDLTEPFLSNTKYKLAVSPGGLRLVDVGVSRGLSAEFFTEPGHQCEGAIALRLVGLPRDSESGKEEFWQPLFAYIKSAGRDPGNFVTVNISKDDTKRPLGLRSLSTPTTDPTIAAATRRMIVCLDPDTTLPEEPFAIEVQFKNNPPPMLTDRLTGAGLSGAGSPSFADASAPPGVPGDRPLERNLDLGASFTSSVDPVPAEEGAPADAPTIFKRTNRGVLDIRLAPLLNLQTTTLPDPGQKWFKFWTPIYLDANIATGKIEKETISLNRVIIGSEVEFRLIDFKKRINEFGTIGTDTSRTNNFYRFILRGNHASDRDFKQLEYTGTFEFQPIFAAVYKPLEANFKIVQNKISGKDEYKVRGFGVELFPKVGVSLGRTYARRDPAAAIKESDTIRRFYAGFNFKLNLFRIIELNLIDTFFYRWELPSNRTKNYFKGELNLLIGHPFPQSTHGFFLSFERGNQPPFSNPDVNAVKVGYRIRSDGWFGRIR